MSTSGRTWKLPSPTWPTMVATRPVATMSRWVSSTHSARREIGTQVSVVTDDRRLPRGEPTIGAVDVSQPRRDRHRAALRVRLVVHQRTLRLEIAQVVGVVEVVGRPADHLGRRPTEQGLDGRRHPVDDAVGPHAHHHVGGVVGEQVVHLLVLRTGNALVHQVVHVAHHTHGTDHPALEVAYRRGVHVHPAGAAVEQFDTALERHFLPAQQLVAQLGHFVVVFVGHEEGDGSAHQLVGPLAAQAGDRRRHPLQHALVIGLEDHIGRVLEDRAVSVGPPVGVSCHLVVHARLVRQDATVVVIHSTATDGAGTRAFGTSDGISVAAAAIRIGAA